MLKISDAPAEVEEPKTRSKPTEIQTLQRMQKMLEDLKPTAASRVLSYLTASNAERLYPDEDPSF